MLPFPSNATKTEMQTAPPSDNEREQRLLDRMLHELRRGDPILIHSRQDAKRADEKPACLIGVLVSRVEDNQIDILTQLKMLNRLATTSQTDIQHIPSPEPAHIAIGGYRAARLRLISDLEDPMRPNKPVLVRNAASASEAGLRLYAAACQEIANPICLTLSSVQDALEITQNVMLAEMADLSLTLMQKAGFIPVALLQPVFIPTATYTIKTSEKHLVEIATACDLLLGKQETLGTALANKKHRLRKVAEISMPLRHAEQARIIAYRDAAGEAEHLAIMIGTPSLEQPLLCRVHSSCFTGEGLGSLRCDCDEQLRGSIERLAQAGGGLILYLAQEGRGIGLINKLHAYALQNAGLDTLEANLQLGFAVDLRDFSLAAEMLQLLGVYRIRLLTNNPHKISALQTAGIEIVEQITHSFPANRYNAAYLHAKSKQLGHRF